MKKIYAMMLAAALAGQSAAQTMTPYEGVNFTNFSSDGRYLVQVIQGSLYMLDTESGDEYACYDPNGMKMYLAGLGGCVTNTGKVVGMNADYAAIWDNGEWVNLPQSTGVGTSYNTAHAITADESRICGVLGNDGASMDGANGKPMAYPVVWTKSAGGEYECQELPFPTRDFTGQVPQYVTAIAISDDGKTIVGQVRDFSGFYVIPVVYRQGEDGNWTYRTIGDREVYDTGRIGELPAYPTPPAMPNAGDYMTEEDVESYNAAVAKYDEDLNKYFSGETDVYPDYPMIADYISDPDRKADYEADMAQYQKDQQKYMEDFTAYQNKLQSIVTNKSFIQNTLCLSANGRYLGVTLEDRGNGGGSWGAVTDKTVGYFDLAQDEPAFQPATAPGDFLTTTMTNDGTILYASPATEYTRSSFAVNPVKGTEAKPFEEYLAGVCPEAGEWVKDENTHDVAIWGYDDDWNSVITDVVEDSVVTGTVMGNSDGTFFVGYYTNTFDSPDQANSVSYTVNLGKYLAGVSAATRREEGATAWFNLQGQRINGAPGRGLYIETKNGKTVKRMAK